MLETLVVKPSFWLHWSEQKEIRAMQVHKALRGYRDYKELLEQRAPMGNQLISHGLMLEILVVKPSSWLHWLERKEI
jgi:hypothetical protein